MSEKKEEIKVGDAVRLNGGGPRMTEADNFPPWAPPGFLGVGGDIPAGPAQLTLAREAEGAFALGAFIAGAVVGIVRSAPAKPVQASRCSWKGCGAHRPITKAWTLLRREGGAGLLFCPGHSAKLRALLKKGETI
jgi:hypothetical protein